MRHGLARSWLVSLALLVPACGGPSSTPAGDAAPSTTDAGATDAGRPVVQIGTRESGAIFTPWHDGDAIPLVRGPQGGVMITPSVAIDGALVPGIDPSFDVVIQNLRASDRAPLADFPGFGPVHAIFARLDTLLVNGPIFDQLGWTEMPGQELIVRARVTGNGVDAAGEVRITTAPSGVAPFDAGQLDGLGDAGVPLDAAP